MRKRFPCGHYGKGQYCHFCEQAREKREAKSEERAARRRAFQQAVDVGLDLSNIPPAVAVKAAGIVRRLRSGSTYHEFNGKRLVRWDRSIISIPVGWSYRLMCRDVGNTIIPTQLISHETYNGIISEARR